MDSKEKEVSYSITNTYSTLNTLSSKTETVWFACHGMGYLSRYFLNHFKGLNTEKNYVIAPQASSKYYLPPKGKHVGASWLTKENTIKETQNVMGYFDAIFENEQLPTHHQMNILGYSQGVSVAMRYMVKRRLQPSNLILISGGIPKELVKADFDYLKDECNIFFIYGTEDEYLDKQRIDSELTSINTLFSGKSKIVSFQGGHGFNKELFDELFA